MSRAPWNIVLHPAAGTAGRPLVTASAAATCRRLHIYQSQGDFIEKLRIAFDNTRLRKPRPAQNIEEQSSVASSSKQGKCPDTCQKRANPQASEVRSFFACWGDAPQAPPRRIIYSAAARFLQNRLIQETSFFYFVIFSFHRFSRKASRVRSHRNPVSMFKGDRGCLSKKRKCSRTCPAAMAPSQHTNSVLGGSSCPGCNERISKGRTIGFLNILFILTILKHFIIISKTSGVYDTDIKGQDPDEIR